MTSAAPRDHSEHMQEVKEYNAISIVNRQNKINAFATKL
jgi:hypothetical protein